MQLAGYTRAVLGDGVQGKLRVDYVPGFQPFNTFSMVYLAASSSVSCLEKEARDVGAAPGP